MASGGTDSYPCARHELQTGDSRPADLALEPQGAAVRPGRRMAAFRCAVRRLFPAAEQEAIRAKRRGCRRRGARRRPTRGDGNEDEAARPDGGHAVAGDDDSRAARHGASREESLASTDFATESGRACARDRGADAAFRQTPEASAVCAVKPRFHHGRRLDLQGTIRRSVACGGTPLRLAWKERRRVRPRLVLLLDVSRSMSLYSFFYLRLARALCGELARRALLHLPHAHHRRRRGACATRIRGDRRNACTCWPTVWAGGTRIGECLTRFQSRPRGAPGAFAYRRDHRQRRLRYRRARAAGGGARDAAAALDGAWCGSTRC